jgi:hypothetical protein
VEQRVTTGIECILIVGISLWADSRQLEREPPNGLLDARADVVSGLPAHSTGERQITDGDRGKVRPHGVNSSA